MNLLKIKFVLISFWDDLDFKRPARVGTIHNCFFQVLSVEIGVLSANFQG